MDLPEGPAFLRDKRSGWGFPHPLRSLVPAPGRAPGRGIILLEEEACGQAPVPPRKPGSGREGPAPHQLLIEGYQLELVEVLQPVRSLEVAFEIVLPLRFPLEGIHLPLV